MTMGSGGLVFQPAGNHLPHRLATSGWQRRKSWASRKALPLCVAGRARTPPAPMPLQLMSIGQETSTEDYQPDDSELTFVVPKGIAESTAAKLKLNCNGAIVERKLNAKE